jgi:hypothetical protein
VSRYVIAIDGKKAFLRRTLSVTHDEVKGEARYDTRPVNESRAPARVKAALRALRRKNAIARDS